jgi:hypothetical protein
MAIGKHCFSSLCSQLTYLGFAFSILDKIKCYLAIENFQNDLPNNFILFLTQTFFLNTYIPSLYKVTYLSHWIIYNKSLPFRFPTKKIKIWWPFFSIKLKQKTRKYIRELKQKLIHYIRHCNHIGSKHKWTWWGGRYFVTFMFLVLHSYFEKIKVLQYTQW